ncbi:MAG: ABC transporter permease [Candidatus Eremiobacteraeota bacterium]|nr:ABC transporter permease [Candidatus Eremiobacteraeota bacterium]MBC5804370.1 ABC transporter permease [Candidatus Eremiobacteraeota bacterium]MBC5820556.1 ABC transporter permease [Candidatus Eremiobacteraeota bacterium]
MKVFDDVGRGTTGFAEYAGGVATLFAESTSFICRLRIRLAETVAQAYFLGVQSVGIVLLTSLFTGMVITLESANQAKSYGASSLVGGAVAYVSSRELGPMLTAVVVAGRAGAAMAAELGSMVVTEQIEALEALGLSPVRMLVVPRLVAMVCTLPLLVILADIVSIFGGMYLAREAAGISYDSFLTSARQFSFFGDYLKGMVKAVFFGIIIVVIACYQGFGVRGGAAGVGKATTGAVVTAIILIFITNFFLSIVLYGTTGAQ